jgi:hypothetical protein
MISEKEIFERLMKGENLDDIMNEITASVNGALEAKKKADAEAEEAKRKAEAAAKLEAEAKARKDSAMFNLDAIINGLCGLLVVYGYTDEAAELAKMDEEDKNDLLDSLDSMMELCKWYLSMSNTTFPLGGTKPAVKKVEVGKNPTVEVKTAKAFDASDAITKFLKGYGLI